MIAPVLSVFASLHSSFGLVIEAKYKKSSKCYVITITTI